MSEFLDVMLQQRCCGKTLMDHHCWRQTSYADDCFSQPDRRHGYFNFAIPVILDLTSVVTVDNVFVPTSQPPQHDKPCKQVHICTRMCCLPFLIIYHQLA